MISFRIDWFDLLAVQGTFTLKLHYLKWCGTVTEMHQWGKVENAKIDPSARKTKVVLKSVENNGLLLFNKLCSGSCLNIIKNI